MIDGPANEPVVPPAVAASIERWKQALLDLSKRNRALNFRGFRVSTITVVDEQPPEVLRRLYVDRESMGFRPAAPARVVAAPAHDIASEEHRDFAPYAREALPAQHTDRWLQTAVSADDLAKSLRRIDDLARSSLEEQGVNTLFLALGMLHYTEPDRPGESFAAPLVLLPVRLVRAAARSAFEIIAADDDVAVNLSLGEYLRKLWAIELPQWSEGDGELDLQQLFVQVAERIRGRDGWRLTNEIVLGLFSFEKLVMFKDLEASAAAIGNHALVQQLVTRQGATPSGLGLPTEVQHARLDEVIPPERSAHLVPADGSQLRALLAVARGHSLVVEGPPGTGKSQTITNLVAQALGAGKSVLFVAEKRAALDVVHARLESAGMGELCLALHSPDANRREVFEGMRAALDASAEPSTARAVAGPRLPGVRASLSAYTDAIHRVRAPQQASVFEALGRLATVADAPLLPWQGGVDAIDAAAI
ncbi:MAG: DUF4011 domain-containing protein, partial [Deltaproteobacteria bacterium]|nr:DUF4011 domain-containing protein [Nannocystaceae bacterium]